jgi:hypothetical protein
MSIMSSIQKSESNDFAPGAQRGAPVIAVFAVNQRPKLSGLMLPFRLCSRDERRSLHSRAVSDKRLTERVNHMKRFFSFLILSFFALLCAREANAARAYFDGNIQSLSTVCPVLGSVVVANSSYVGYFTDPSEPYPRVSDLGYVRAVSANVSGCVGDAVGFEFFMPLGANLAISQSTPVICIRGRLDGSFTEQVANDSNGSCSQTPLTGTNGGLYFGFSALPSGWYLEIRVPVTYSQQLFGLGGPTSHRLTAATISAYGTAFPFQPVTVFAGAPVNNTLTVTKNGTGTGTVTSNLSGINCGATCSASYASTASVTLTATPAANSIFQGWSGACSGSNPTCTVSMSSARSVNAQFSRGIGSLSITLAGALPAGVSANLTITGPDGFSNTRALQTGLGISLSDVPTGSYTVTAQTITLGNRAYTAPPQNATVNFGVTTNVSVTYGVSVSGSNDLNADGRSDILLRNTDGSVYGLVMNGTTSTSGAYITTGNAWVAVATGDFNGDARADIILRNTDGSLYVLLMNGTTVTSGAYITTGNTWSFASAADYSGDGKADIVLRNTNDGSLYLLLMNGATVASGAYLTTGDQWKVANIGTSVANTTDLNGDGKADIILRNADGSLYMLIMNGTTVTSGAYLTTGATWTFAGTGDLNRDNRSDIILRQTDGSLYMLLMNGTTVQSGAYLTTGNTWGLATTTDFDGDGRSDIMLRQSNGSLYVLLMNGTTVQSGAYLTTGNTWSYRTAGDYNGDGRSDIVIQHNTDGSSYILIMNGTAVTSGAYLLGPASPWVVTP